MNTERPTPALTERELLDQLEGLARELRPVLARFAQEDVTALRDESEHLIERVGRERR